MKKSLSRKFLFAFIISLVLASLYHVMVLEWVLKTQREKLSAYINEITSSVANSIELTVSNMVNTEKNISGSKDVQAMCVDMNVNPVTIKNMLTMAQTYNPQMMDLMLVDRSGSVYGMVGYLKSSVEGQAKITANQYFNSESNAPSITFFEVGDSGKYILHCMPVFSTHITAYYGRKIGAVAMLSNANTLTKIISAPSNVYIEIIDSQNGDIVLSNADSLLLGENGLSKLNRSYTHTSKISGTALLVRGTATNSNLDVEGSMSSVYIFTSIIIMLILCVSLGIVSNRLFLHPINKLNSEIIRLEQEDASQRLREISNDEIGSIGMHINNLLDTIYTLNKNVVESQERLYQMDILKTKTQLYAYQSQINPHFLYNMLQCMRGIALSRDMTEIADICTGMAAIFRYSIKGESVVPLEKELEITDLYLNMLRIRFQDKLRYSIDGCRDFRNCAIPKLTLQPLVENAVFHGLASLGYEGTVMIYASQSSNKLQLTIYNDGVEIPAERLSEISEELKAPVKSGIDTDNGAHIGILNVHNKIRLNFGSEYGLDIKSNGEGTTVTVFLPGGTMEGNSINYQNF